MIHLDPFNGAIGRIPAQITAFVHRNSLFFAEYKASLGPTDSALVAKRNLDWVQRTHAAMAPYASGSSYEGFLDPTVCDWKCAYYGANLPKLIAVKRKYDPDDLFRFRQSIRT